jgi:sirohydrochlorin cobaltochelatase
LKQVLILLAHGSRDPQWSRSFRRLASLLSKRFLVKVAYLEFMRPSLDGAIASLATAGVRSVRVVPVFVGSGRHLKRDLAKKAAALRKQHKGLRITVERAIGEKPEVIKALARAIAAGIPSPRRSARRS